MNTKHTPGPWTYDDVWSLVTGPKREEIAAIHAAQSNPKRCDRGIAQANAHLIAAAPELLEALVAMIAADTAICENAGSKSDQAMNRIAALDMANAAIFKATKGAQ